jgi:hypothetical protein
VGKSFFLLLAAARSRHSERFLSSGSGTTRKTIIVYFSITHFDFHSIQSLCEHESTLLYDFIRRKREKSFLFDEQEEKVVSERELYKMSPARKARERELNC